MSFQMSSALLKSRFQILQELGEGSYGIVLLANDLYNSMNVALKIINKKSLKKMTQINRLRREINIHKLLDHPNIAKVYDVLETEDQIIMVMEYIAGGDLFDYIVEKKRLCEEEARKLYRQLVSALIYCHRNFIVHRDLKPENLLLDANNNLKIIDFGFVRSFEDQASEKLKTYCGSLYYCSPEMIDGVPYTGPSVDMWSMGVILYVFTNGYLPFRKKNIVELYDNIRNASFEDGDYSSNSCNDLIRKLIQSNPNHRLSIREVARHPWISQGCTESLIDVADSQGSDTLQKSQIMSQLHYIEEDPKSVELKIKKEGIKSLSLVIRGNSDNDNDTLLASNSKSNPVSRMSTEGYLRPEISNTSVTSITSEYISCPCKDVNECPPMDKEYATTNPISLPKMNTKPVKFNQFKKFWTNLSQHHEQDSTHSQESDGKYSPKKKFSQFLSITSNKNG